MKLNRVSDITVCLKAAASDRKGETIFYYNPEQSVGSSLMAEAVMRAGTSKQEIVKVPMVTIDDVLAGNTEPGLIIKIDAEGVDFRVIDGMVKTIATRLCTDPDRIDFRIGKDYTDPVSRLLNLGRTFEMIEVGLVPRLIPPDQSSIERLVSEVTAREFPVTDIVLIRNRLPASAKLRDRILRG